MMELEHGVVVNYNPIQRYGFLKVLDKDGQETGEPDIFFHFSNGQFVETVGDKIVFAGRKNRETGLRLWHPVVGMKLAFERSVRPNDNREQANPWTYAEGYDNRVYELTTQA